jgi:phosphoribosylanthranilate isomerase
MQKPGPGRQCWIKICANTNLEDAAHAAQCGANAVGFVFAPSPRRITPAEARAITTRLPRSVEKYGVFVDPTFDEVITAVSDALLTGVQLHSTPDPGLALRLREHFARHSRTRVGILRVLHYDADLGTQLESLRHDHAVDAVLIDSRSATAAGGTGLRYNWAAASTSFLAAAPHLRLIAAGGLDPDNVTEAIHTLEPWGVDVASGVERSPAIKDPAKVRAFILAARAAAVAARRHARA